jgi:uncharacterized protein YerC
MGDLTISQDTALEVIESLRNGIPPKTHLSLFSEGDGFARQVRTRHFSRITRGKIRWVSGNWGSGKTHFLRRLAEEAFEENLLVSAIELRATETPFNKFEKVLSAIIRNVTSREAHYEPGPTPLVPFGDFLHRKFFHQVSEAGNLLKAFENLETSLLLDSRVDIDFKKAVLSYWRSYLNDGIDGTSGNQIRDQIMQWFLGEGTLGEFRRKYDIQKMITKENTKTILNSLGGFVQFCGYPGLVVLFDEAEQAHTTMRKSNLHQAQNNLLHLVNEIPNTPGVVMIYATTPSFFEDEVFGIKAYGALQQRINELPNESPSPLDKVWNLDLIPNTVETFTKVAQNLYDLYTVAYPDDLDALGDRGVVSTQVAKVLAQRNEFARISRWRLAITTTIQSLDRLISGRSLATPQEQYKSILDALSDE